MKHSTASERLIAQTFKISEEIKSCFNSADKFI